MHANLSYLCTRCKPSCMQTCRICVHVAYHHACRPVVSVYTMHTMHTSSSTRASACMSGNIPWGEEKRDFLQSQIQLCLCLSVSCVRVLYSAPETEYALLPTVCVCSNMSRQTLKCGHVHLHTERVGRCTSNRVCCCLLGVIPQMV